MPKKSTRRAASQASKGVVICESPGKVSKIGSILGSGYLVLSSRGHVWDLPPDRMGVSESNGFQPEYQVTKPDVVRELKSACRGQTVWLAADADREGEAIAWSISQLVQAKKTHRISFHSITEADIHKAIRNPGVIDQHLVDAQTARRVLDRLYGYTLSPLIASGVPGATSAGRVQSVTARLVHTTTLARREAATETWWSLEASTAGLSWKLCDEDGTLQLTSGYKRITRETAGNKLKIERITTERQKTPPPPPFETSTLQASCTGPLRKSSGEVMKLAQRLYERGWITYIRTDCTDLAEECHAAIEEYVREEYGSEWYHRREGGGSTDSQEAHEAIRPTEIRLIDLSKVCDAQAMCQLYELIWKRTIASQMSDLVVDQTEVGASSKSIAQYEAWYWSTSGAVLISLGWKVLYGYQDRPLPPLRRGERHRCTEARAVQTWSTPPPLYSEAGLIKAMKAKGIGRPSTYASTIATLLARGYVQKESSGGEECLGLDWVATVEDGLRSVERNHRLGGYQSKLVITPLGEKTVDWLMENYHPLMRYSFTRSMERDLDQVARGQKQYLAVVSTCYQSLPERVYNGPSGSKASTQALSLTHCGLSVSRGRGYLEVGPFKLKCDTDDPENYLREYPVWTLSKKGDVHVMMRTGQWGPYLQIASGNQISHRKPNEELLQVIQTGDVRQIRRALRAYLKSD